MNYLYNGVELAELPEWDSKTYPYVCAYFGHDGFDTYYAHFVFLSKLHKLEKDDSGELCVIIPEDETVGVSSTEGVSMDELQQKSLPKPNFYTRYYTIKYNNLVNGVACPSWSNFDVLDEDGALYLSASDPIPVSTFTPDPISMTMGWLVGRRIAGQRK